MTTITGFDLYAVDLPFRKPFKHAAAERSTSSSVFIRCRTDAGVVGYGECLPREYVTGETRDGTFDLLEKTILPRLVGRSFESLAAVQGFLRECDGKAPPDWLDPATPQTASWCAVDLALQDALGQTSGEPVRLTDDRDFPSGVRYSVVLSADSGFKTVVRLLLMRLLAIRQVKLKIKAGEEVAAARRVRFWLGRRGDVRVDGNMLWSVDEALAIMPEMARAGVHSFEQPVAAADVDGLTRLVAETDLGVMVDESLSDRASLTRLIEAKACTAVNVRISKCGGLVAALARCREALAAGLTVQIGCQVGESSLLSAAHLTLVTAVRDVRYAEGCFGRLLLRDDPVEPLLQFRYGGRPPQRPSQPGLGVTVNETKLAGFTGRTAKV